MWQNSTNAPIFPATIVNEICKKILDYNSFYLVFIYYFIFFYIFTLLLLNLSLFIFSHYLYYFNMLYLLCFLVGALRISEGAEAVAEHRWTGVQRQC